MTKPQKPQPGWPARIAKRTKKGIEGRIAQGQQRATRQIPDVIVNPLAPLPDELILEIFEQLIRLWELGSRGTMRIVPATTFAALALSCRYLYPFAMRFLYSTYHASLEAPLISFLRTIASQPHLVMRIKDIQTTDLRDDDYFDGCTLSRTTEAMAAEIRTAALPYEQKWLAELAFEPEEVDVALLVLRSRKLQSLVIVRRWLGHASYQELPIVLDPIVEFCKKLPVEPTQAYDYKKLRRLDIRMSGLCLGQVAHILRLPSLTSLALQDFAYNDALIAREKRLQWPVSPGTSGLQKVYILSSTIPSDVLVSLLESCKAVKSFEYMASMIPVAPVQWYADTLRALGMHRDTLEQLCIDSDEGDVAFWDRGLPAYLPCAIIKGMQSLTRLKINFVVLMGKPRGRYQVHDADRTQDLEWRGYISTLRDLLPPNLAELTLLMDRSSLTWDVDYDRQLWTLLPTDPSSSTSSIDALHIKYDHDIPAGKFPIRLSDLAKRCKQAGVAYAYTAYALVDDRYEFRDVVHRLADMGEEGLAIASQLEKRFGNYPGDIPTAVKARLESSGKEDFDGSEDAGGFSDFSVDSEESDDPDVDDTESDYDW